MSVTFEDLVGENAFMVMGTMRDLLKQVEGAIPEYKGLAEKYTAEAQAGDYDNLLRVSHAYALKFAATTLEVAEKYEAYLTDNDEDEDEDA